MYHFQSCKKTHYTFCQSDLPGCPPLNVGLMLQRQRLVSLLINKNLQNKKHIIVCPKIFTGTKTNLLRRFVHVIWEMLINFFSSFGSHSEHLTQFFKCYHPRLLQYKILVTKTSHFLAELKSDKLEGALKGRNLENFE